MAEWLTKRDRQMANDAIRIDDISNYHGTLAVVESEGEFFWMIEDHDDASWLPVSENLYRALVEHQNGQSET